MKHFVIGTAGHIDHGKTSLVQALTGVDTDRLQEEKRRGITIELGFAELQLADDISCGIVDVPGHERFVKTMVAGVSGIDLVMLVISAEEGVKPQTIEHLDIVQLLGVSRGVVVLTKQDLVSPDRITEVTHDVGVLLEGTFLEEAPVCAVSVRTGEGLDLLKQQLRGLLASAVERSQEGIVRMPIDRVFSVSGFGTVVTGTVAGGMLSVGDEIGALPGGPQGKIRGLQVHGRSVATAGAGQRVAVNIQGVDHHDLIRGMVLTKPGAVLPTRRVDVRLWVSLLAGQDIPHRAELHCHSGTRESMATIIALEGDLLAAGGCGMVQLRFAEPMALFAGDRFVVRAGSPLVTVGGGRILDPHPPAQRRRTADAMQLLEALWHDDMPTACRHMVSQARLSGISLQLLSERLGIQSAEVSRIITPLVVNEGWIVTSGETFWCMDGAAVEELVDHLYKTLKQYLAHNPHKRGIGKEELRSKLPRRTPPFFFAELLGQLSQRKGVVVEREQVCIADEPVKQLDPLVVTLETAGLEVPSVKDLVQKNRLSEKVIRDRLQESVRQRDLKRVSSDFYYPTAVLEELERRLTEYLLKHGEITPVAFREMTGLSRKYVIPLLEFFDSEKITIRIGDSRRLRRQAIK